LIAILDRVQSKRGLDLGLCQYLNHKSSKGILEYLAGQNVDVLSLSICLPLGRNSCGLRLSKLEKQELYSKTKKRLAKV